VAAQNGRSRRGFVKSVSELEYRDLHIPPLSLADSTDK